MVLHFYAHGEDPHVNSILGLLVVIYRSSHACTYRAAAAVAALWEHTDIDERLQFTHTCEEPDDQTRPVQTQTAFN